MTDAWDWWRAKYAGEPLELHEGTPHAGFYRAWRRQEYGAPRTSLPVAYWPGENGELNCRIGDRDVTPQHGCDIWVSVGNNPVSEEVYREVAEKGGAWPDEHPLVPMGHNRPPEDNSFEGLRDAVKDLAAEAERRLDGPPIADKDEADRIANLADRLAELHNKIDDARRAEKKPFDDGAIAVQKKWAPLLLAAETYKNLKYKLLTAWFRKQEELAKQKAEEAAEMGEPPIEPQRPRAGTRGRAMSLKSTKIAEITDYAAALEFFKDNDAVREVVQKLADRAARAGITVPGVTVKEESQAV